MLYCTVIHHFAKKISSLHLWAQTDPVCFWTCLSIDNFAMVSGRKACDMFKVSQCYRENVPDLHSESFKYSLRILHKTLLPLKSGISLRFYVLEFIELKNLLPKSSVFNPADYLVLGIAADGTVTKFLETNQLKRVLIECWARLILNTFTPAIDQLLKY